METLALLAVAAIVLAAFSYALLPLLRPQEALAAGDEGSGAEEIVRLLSERERAYRDIQEIEMDREMEKLSEEDYAEMIARARSVAIDVLRRLEARGVREGMAPANLDGREAARAAAGAHPAAGDHPAAGAHSAAGAPLDAEPVSARSSLDERLEAEILAFREVPPSGEESPDPSRDESGPNFCPACGQPVGGVDNFCSSCGKKIG